FLKCTSFFFPSFDPLLTENSSGEKRSWYILKKKLVHLKLQRVFDELDAVHSAKPQLSVGSDGLCAIGQWNHVFGLLSFCFDEVTRLAGDIHFAKIFESVGLVREKFDEGVSGIGCLVLYLIIICFTYEAEAWSHLRNDHFDSLSSALERLILHIQSLMNL